MTDINTTGTKLASVTAQLVKAAKAGATMIAACKEAAKLASAQFDNSLPVQDRVKVIAALYSAELKTMTADGAAIFRDSLLLLAAPRVPVTLASKDKDGKEVETHTTAEACFGLGKHSMKDAAKQVRESLGIARKAGGGRKPRQPAAPVQTTADSPDLALAAFLNNLPVYMADKEAGPKVAEILGNLGWVKAAEKHKAPKKEKAPTLTLSTPLV
jgi:hypothetical protein